MRPKRTVIARRRIPGQASRWAETLQTARQNIMQTRLRTKVWLEHDSRFILGDGGLQLLLGIIEHGSLRGAARAIGWSYRHAWGYLRSAEVVVGAPLTVPRPGRGRGRGTSLTETGRILMERLAAGRNRIDDLLGANGPTRVDVAVRGRRADQRETNGVTQGQRDRVADRTPSRRAARSTGQG